MARLEHPLIQCAICPRRFRGRSYGGSRYCSPACRQQAYRDRLGNAKPALDRAPRDAQGPGDLPIGAPVEPQLGGEVAQLRSA